MRNLNFDNEYDLETLLSQVLDTTLVSDMYEDSFYKPIIDELIFNDIVRYDIQELQGIADSYDRTSMYRKELGDGVVIDLLVEGGYERDIQKFILDNYITD